MQSKVRLRFHKILWPSQNFKGFVFCFLFLLLQFFSKKRVNIQAMEISSSISIRARANAMRFQHKLIVTLQNIIMPMMPEPGGGRGVTGPAPIFGRSVNQLFQMGEGRLSPLMALTIFFTFKHQPTFKKKSLLFYSSS